jgi:hypothetical protein
MIFQAKYITILFSNKRSHMHNLVINIALYVTFLQLPKAIEVIVRLGHAI